MSPIQQQRLIGAILLLCLLSGIAFFLMSNANEPDDNLQAEVIAPAFTSVIEAIPEGDVEIMSNEAEEALLDPHNLAAIEKELEIKQSVVTKEVTDQKESDKPIKEVKLKAPVSSPSITVWFLQVGSFSVEANALKMQQQVLELGYEAKITQSGKAYRVRVGPNDNKTQLEKVALKLQNKLQIKSQIIQKTN